MISRAGQSKTVDNVGIQKKASKEQDASLIDKEVDSENLHQTFAHGMSGILDEGKRNTMPAFMEKLAEEEAAILNEDEPVVDLINVEFDDEPLTRGDDVTSDESRRIEGFEIEKPSQDKIEKETEVLLAEGNDLTDIAKELKRKFPAKAVEKFVETHQKELLQKYGQLGYIYLDKRMYDSCEDIKAHLARLPARNLLTKLKESETSKVKCRDCTKYKSGYCLLTNLKVANMPEITSDKEAKFVINKFASIDISIRDQFIERLAAENPARVIAEFLVAAENLRRESGQLDSNFKRDNDQKEMKERLVDNNNAKNAAIEEAKLNSAILQDLKAAIESGIDVKEAHKRLTQTYTPLQLESVYAKHASEIESFVKFYNRNKEAKIERFENEGSKKDILTAKNKVAKEKELFREMMKHADLMLSEGNDAKTVQDSLKKTFGIDKTIKFMSEHARILNKHYGQIGYVYIDSNLYGNCDKMAEALKGLKHAKKPLLYNVKACQNCAKCSQNEAGLCKKVDLMISNNPVITSPRAASKLFKRAEATVPKEYIENFSKKISVVGAPIKTIYTHENSESMQQHKHILEQEKISYKVLNEKEIEAHFVNAQDKYKHDQALEQDSNMQVADIKEISKTTARVVSEFILGLKKLAETDAISKTASVNTEIQKNFRTVETLKTNIFKSSSVSKIAEEVLKGE